MNCEGGVQLCRKRGGCGLLPVSCEEEGIISNGDGPAFKAFYSFIPVDCLIRFKELYLGSVDCCHYPVTVYEQYFILL